LLTELLLAEVAGRRFRWRFWWRLGGRLRRCRVPREAREGAQSGMTGFLCSVRGWSLLVVVSCGRSTNDHPGTRRGGTGSGFSGGVRTATSYPQFDSSGSATWPVWAAASAAAHAVSRQEAGAPAEAGAQAHRSDGTGYAHHATAAIRRLPCQGSAPTGKGASRSGRSQLLAGSISGSAVGLVVRAAARSDAAAAERAQRRTWSAATTTRAPCRAAARPCLGDAEAPRRTRPVSPLGCRPVSGWGGGAAAMALTRVRAAVPGQDGSPSRDRVDAFLGRGWQTSRRSAAREAA
jgi:hypothetical protein